MSRQAQTTDSVSRRELTAGIVGCLIMALLGYLAGRWIVVNFGIDRAGPGPQTPVIVALGVLFVAFFVFSGMVGLRLRRLEGATDAVSTDPASGTSSRGLRVTAAVFALAALFAATVVFTLVVVAAATPR